MFEKLILIIAKYKTVIDIAVLFALIASQWPLYLIEVVSEKRKIDSEINTDYFLAGIMLLFGLYALSYHIINKAIEVTTTRGYLTLAGKIFTVVSLAVYIFIVYLFLSMTCSVIYLTLKKDKKKIT